MSLVLFDDALEHLTRIHRVIRMDQVFFVKCFKRNLQLYFLLFKGEGDIRYYI